MVLTLIVDLTPVISHIHYKGDDLVNVSDKDIYVVANVNADGYTGKINANFPFFSYSHPVIS